MERNQKLQLKADEAVILKTFENKLPTLFGRSATDTSAIKMVTSTRDTWLPGIPSYKQWETSNHLGGLKVVIQDQIGTVEGHYREAIKMNVPDHAKA
eukprot:4274415-Ditylum_brightwellii.AAC.1